MSPEQWLATQQAQQSQPQAATVTQPQQPKQQAAMSPEQWAASQQEKPEMGFLESIGEAITGSRRTTEESRTLPEWTGMPELNQMSMASFKSALGTLVSNPKETVQVLQSNFPGIQVRQDPKGNYILRSSINQQEYVIPPGVSLGDIPRIIGGVLAFTPAGRATTLPTMAAKSAATQAAIEASQAATGGEFDVSDVIVSGVTAPIIPAIAKVPGLARELIRPLPAEPVKKAAIESAEQAGIRVLTSDVARPETFIGKTAQQIGERIPVAGTGPVRAAQQAERMDAVKKLFSEYGVTGAENFSDDIIQDVVKKRSSLVNKYTSMKNDVFNKVDIAGTVPLNRTVQKIDDEILRLQNVSGSKPLIDRLQEFKSTIQNNPNISTVEANRKILGDWMGDQSLASIKTETDKVARKIYGPLKEDMGDFISANGSKNDLVKWRVADRRLAESIGDLEKTAFKSAIDKADVTPELVMNMLLSKKPSDSAMLYKSLSPEGRNLAKSAIINQVASKSSIPDATVPGGQVFSPEAFAKEIGRLDPSIKTFFKGDDLKQLEGLSRAITLTQRASQAGVSPTTGAQAVPFVAGSGLAQFFASQGFGPLGTLIGSAATIGAIGGAARVYESAAVRNLMIRLSSVPKGTKEETKLLNKLALTIQQMERDKQAEE